MEITGTQRSKNTAWIFLAIWLVWGYMLTVWFPLPYLGIGLTLFALSAAVISFAWFRANGKTPSKASYLYLVALALLVLSFALFENSGIKYQLFLLLPCLFACWLLHGAEDRPLSERDIWDSFSLLFIKPFSGLREKSVDFAIKAERRGQAKYVVIGVGITIPVFMIAVHLLAQADPNFNTILSRVFCTLTADLGTFLFRLGAACVVGLYLLSMLMSASRPPKREGKRPLPQANGTVMSILIGALCALYVAFLAVQLMSVSGVFAEPPNPNNTNFYSRYARDGFFEFCQITLLNLAVFLGAHIFRKEATRSMRILLTALGILTQLLTVTAIVRMGLYMDQHGLTLLRMYTTWFMISLFLAFGMLVALQWKKFAGFKAIAVLAVVSMLTISYANIGGIVAKVNVDRFLAESLDTMEIKQYREFPYEAATHLIRLHGETDDAGVKRDVGEFLEWLDGPGRRGEPQGGRQGDVGWCYKSVQRMLAEEEIGRFLAE